jgi:putative membrane protein
MNRKHVRSAVLATAVVLTPLAVIGQNDPSANPSPIGPQNSTLPTQGGAPSSGGINSTGMSPAVTTSMRDTLGAPGQTGREMVDEQFMRAAAQGGVGAVKLGVLATQKGGPEVKEFSQKMVADHTAINKDMGEVADDLGVMLPKKMNKDDQAEYNKLNGLSGDAFDKEFIAYMMKEHRQDLHDYRTEASVASDPDLQAEVVKAAMVIRQHLIELTKLATAKGVPVPPRPQRPAAPPA